MQVPESDVCFCECIICRALAFAIPAYYPCTLVGFGSYIKIHFLYQSSLKGTATHTNIKKNVNLQ